MVRGIHAVTCSISFLNHHRTSQVAPRSDVLAAGDGADVHKIILAARQARQLDAARAAVHPRVRPRSGRQIRNRLHVVHHRAQRRI